MHNPLRGRGGGGHQNVESHYCMAFIVKFEVLTFEAFIWIFGNLAKIWLSLCLAYLLIYLWIGLSSIHNSTSWNYNHPYY